MPEVQPVALGRGRSAGNSPAVATYAALSAAPGKRTPAALGFVERDVRHELSVVVKAADRPTRYLLTTREIAALLGLSPAAVLRRWRSGELPGYRLASNVLRFDAAEIDSWLDARRGSSDTPGPSTST